MTQAELRMTLGARLAEHGIARAWLFGSRARGDERADSDVDLLVDFARRPGLIAFFGIETALSDAVGLEVNLVERSALRPDFGRAVQQDAIPVP